MLRFPSNTLPKLTWKMEGLRLDIHSISLNTFSLQRPCGPEQPGVNWWRNISRGTLRNGMIIASFNLDLHACMVCASKMPAILAKLHACLCKAYFFLYML